MQAVFTGAREEMKVHRSRLHLLVLPIIFSIRLYSELHESDTTTGNSGDKQSITNWIKDL